MHLNHRLFASNVCVFGQGAEDPWNTVQSGGGTHTFELKSTVSCNVKWSRMPSRGKGDALYSQSQYARSKNVTFDVRRTVAHLPILH